jgi:hypothetical protein
MVKWVKKERLLKWELLKTWSYRALNGAENISFF